MRATLWEISHHPEGPFAYRVYTFTPGEAAKQHALALDKETHGLPPKSRTIYVRLPLGADEYDLRIAQAYGLAPRQAVCFQVQVLYHVSVVAIESSAAVTP